MSENLAVIAGSVMSIFGFENDDVAAKAPHIAIQKHSGLSVAMRLAC